MKHTGPALAVVQQVRARDGHACVICLSPDPLTTQHRVSRGMGGSLPDWVNLPANLITLCGSGTTGCHGWVEAHPTFAQEAGWSVRRTVLFPADVPVLYPEGWMLLNDYGTRSPVDAAVWGLPASVEGPRGHRGSGGSGWGEVRVDPQVGPSWPARTPGPGWPTYPV